MISNPSQVPITIDVEASGFGRGSYPIEVGFITGNGDAHCKLISPCESWTHWDPEAEAVHGVSREILADHGHPARSIAEWLNQHLAGQTVYSDAWANDMSWLGTLFNEVELPQRFRIESILVLLDPEQTNRWDSTKQTMIDTHQSIRHRASSDARTVQQTFMALQEPQQHYYR